jgi:hypothetical protein
MLDILLQVLKSHHLTSETFGRRFTSTFYFDPKHNINVKRFKTAFIIGSAPFFNEADSRTNVVNLFEADGGSNKSWPHERHIFCLKLLQYLAKREAFTIGEILVEIERILGKSYLEPTRDCIRRFWQKGLIVTEALAAKETAYFTRSAKDADFSDLRVQQGHSFVSPNGRFHLGTLIRDDIYLDEMKFATDLSEDEMSAVFAHRDQEADAWARLRATGAFVRLIADCESKTALSKILGVQVLGPAITKAYNDRKAAERMGWQDM